jgi:hypothetical protein
MMSTMMLTMWLIMMMTMTRHNHEDACGSHRDDGNENDGKPYRTIL